MRLVVCCDGTWNDPDDQTHIHRLSKAIASERDDDVPQRVFYDTGVGTVRFERLRGGALGRGLSENVREAYRWLVDNHRDGDEIFCFGFSRGAYTVRSLCGFVAYAGLLRREDAGSIRAAYDAYRFRAHQRKAAPFHDSEVHRRARKVRIRFLGVFDTVGALGVPVDWIQDIVNDLPDLDVRFHDTRLSPLIDCACHALALDERRGPYRPTLWTGEAHQVPGRAGNSVPQKVRQVWFAGVHSDIGGGYNDDKALADVPLAWMVDQARAEGLVFKADFGGRPLAPDPAGRLHDSYGLKWRFIDRISPSIDPYVRPVGARQRRARGEADAPVIGECLHPSVLDRIEGEASRRLRSPYAPPSLVAGGRLRSDLDVEVFRD